MEEDEFVLSRALVQPFLDLSTDCEPYERAGAHEMRALVYGAVLARSGSEREIARRAHEAIRVPRGERRRT